MEGKVFTRESWSAFRSRCAALFPFLKKTFQGTIAEWNALTSEEQAVYDARDIIDDAGGDIALYINNQLELSDFERFNITSTQSNYTFTMEYDGYVTLYATNRGTWNIVVNGVNMAGGVPEDDFAEGGTVYAQKGDTIVFTQVRAAWIQGVRYYKLRDYSQRP